MCTWRIRSGYGDVIYCIEWSYSLLDDNLLTCSIHLECEFWFLTRRSLIGGTLEKSFLLPDQKVENNEKSRE